MTTPIHHEVSTEELYRQACADSVREATRRKIEVMQAWLEGKTLESRLRGESIWHYCDASTSLFWNWEQVEYRIAAPAKKKVEMWQWVVQREGQLPHLTPRFFRTLEAVGNYYLGVPILQRADWTRIEVEE